MLSVYVEKENAMTDSTTPDDPRNTDEQLVCIRAAMQKLSITGDSLFSRIREDIERGLIGKARNHLDFVDKIVAADNDADRGRPDDRRAAP